MTENTNYIPTADDLKERGWYSENYLDIDWEFDQISDESIEAHLNMCSIAGKLSNIAKKDRGELNGFQLFSEEKRKEIASKASKIGYKNRLERGELIGFAALSDDDRYKLCSKAGSVSTCKDYIWWFNGKDYKFSKEQPQGYYKSSAPNNPGKSTAKTFWWTNGTSNKRSKECPGPEWYRGRSSNNFGPKAGEKCWWTNGIDTVFQKEAPSENWYKGRWIKNP